MKTNDLFVSDEFIFGGRHTDFILWLFAGGISTVVIGGWIAMKRLTRRPVP